MEKWKDIPGYEGLYQASNTGKIRSIDRVVSTISGQKIRRKGKILTSHKNNYRYEMVSLCKNGKMTGGVVHRFVASAFLSNPNNWRCVNHKDEDRANNSVENLEWCTHSYNMSYSHAKMYRFRSPEGYLTIVRGLSPFCKEAGLNLGSMSSVVAGKYAHSKGWTLAI